MAEHICNAEGFCKAVTREQQGICKAGKLDKFDDHCQYMRGGGRCALFMVGEIKPTESD